MSHNIGQTALRRKRRSVDPMAAYDGLPPMLRHWLAEAALPWSPASARRIWVKSLARGLSPEEALLSLSRAEARSLASEKAGNET